MDKTQEVYEFIVQYIFNNNYPPTIREIGENICVQRIGRPIYKKDEIVMFSYDNGKEQVEECGWIRIVDAKGTFGQSREVSYDIMTPEKGLYKHILESEIMGFKEQ